MTLGKALNLVCDAPNAPIYPDTLSDDPETPFCQWWATTYDTWNMLKVARLYPDKRDLAWACMDIAFSCNASRKSIAGKLVQEFYMWADKLRQEGASNMLAEIDKAFDYANQIAQSDATPSQLMAAACIRAAFLAVKDSPRYYWAFYELPESKRKQVPHILRHRLTQKFKF